MADELAGTGVRVTALCPGWVRTEFHERAEIGISAIPEPMWLDADDVVVEGPRANDAAHDISIPSRRYAALMFARPARAAVIDPLGVGPHLRRPPLAVQPARQLRVP